MGPKHTELHWTQWVSLAGFFGLPRIFGLWHDPWINVIYRRLIWTSHCFLWGPSDSNTPESLGPIISDAGQFIRKNSVLIRPTVEDSNFLNKDERMNIWVCLKIVYPYTQWLMIIIPFLNGYFIGNIPNIFRQTHIWRFPKSRRNPQIIHFLRWPQLLKEPHKASMFDRPGVQWSSWEILECPWFDEEVIRSSFIYVEDPQVYIPVDRMSEIIPYIQRCQKYLLHCPAYSLRNDIHLWLLSGAHLWVSPPLTTHQSQFEIFIFHTFRLPPVSTKANHPSGQDSQLQHPSMYTSTEPFYTAYAILIHKAMVLTAIVPLPSHEPGQLLERLRCFKTQRRSLFQRRPFKKSPFQVAEKKKNATSSKQIQGTWCFGLNGHRRDPYVDDSVPEQCRLDVDLL